MAFPGVPAGSLTASQPLSLSTGSCRIVCALAQTLRQRLHSRLPCCRAPVLAPLDITLRRAVPCRGGPRFLRMLRPGGRLLISDYCRAAHPPSAGFAAYIQQRGYDLHPVDDYARMLSDVGFVDVVGEDRTWQVFCFHASPTMSVCFIRL